MKSLLKRIVTMGLSIIIFAATVIPVSAAQTGTIAGNYFYTDIVTYLWNTPVNSINIGGVTLIDAESMSHYGFTVKWHSNERWLEIVAGSEDISPAAKNGSLLDMKAGKTGTVAGKYYHTDIKTTLNGERIISYNIGGRTFIGAEAMRDFGYDVVWSDFTRELRISMDYLRPTWEWMFTDGSGTTLNDGFSLEFANITKENSGLEFSTAEASGEYKSVGRLTVSDKTVTMVIYTDVKEYGDYWELITENRNIIYGDRKHEDTPKRREELSRVFRFYVNGVEISGEMSYTQGNGHSDYIFIYDKPLRLEDIKTVRLEVGYKNVTR